MSNNETWQLAVLPDGTVQAIYDDELGPVFAALGRSVIRRTSYVEPLWEGGFTNGWQVDLTPVGGPVLGPFPSRREALDAERAWLIQEDL